MLRVPPLSTPVHVDHNRCEDDRVHEGPKTQRRLGGNRWLRPAAYIKARNLQNPANKRNILCDAPLRAVMGKDEVTMFEMTGLVGKHLGPN